MKKIVTYTIWGLLAIYLISIVFKFLQMQNAKSNAKTIYDSHSMILEVTNKANEIQQCRRSQQGPFDNGRKDCYIHFVMSLNSTAGINKLKTELSREGWRVSDSYQRRFSKYFGDSQCIVRMDRATQTDKFLTDNNKTLSVGNYYYHLSCSWSNIFSIS